MIIQYISSSQVISFIQRISLLNCRGLNPKMSGFVLCCVVLLKSLRLLGRWNKH